MVRQYPSPQSPDVYSVIAYYLRGRADVEPYLRERQRRPWPSARNCSMVAVW